MPVSSHISAKLHPLANNYNSLCFSCCLTNTAWVSMCWSGLVSLPLCPETVHYSTKGAGHELYWLAVWRWILLAGLSFPAASHWWRAKLEQQNRDDRTVQLLVLSHRSFTQRGEARREADSSPTHTQRQARAASDRWSGDLVSRLSRE